MDHVFPGFLKGKFVLDSKYFVPLQQQANCLPQLPPLRARCDFYIYFPSKPHHFIPLLIRQSSWWRHFDTTYQPPDRCPHKWLLKIEAQNGWALLFTFRLSKPVVSQLLSSCLCLLKRMLCAHSAHECEIYTPTRTLTHNYIVRASWSTGKTTNWIGRGWEMWNNKYLKCKFIWPPLNGCDGNF